MKKFKTLRDLLNYFRWNPEEDLGEVMIEFIDRPKGIRTIKGDSIKDIGHKFIYLEDDTPLPLHRITRVVYKGETWWVKKG
ncbi:MAG: DUF504 domain-containing protein [Archaeoglobus sp.]|nr:DUF504 domain-containing protein [Archaeoglobus sp.]